METTKVWVSKYALTKGVYEENVEIGNTWGHDEIAFPLGTCFGLTVGKSCFYNRKDAELKAAQMRAAKIASLKKQIAKLEQLDFTKHDEAR